MARDSKETSIKAPPTFVPPQWYRAIASKSILLNVVLAVALVILVWDKINQQERSVYFAATEDGRIVDMQPINEAHLSDVKLSQWIVDALTDIHHWNFTDYEGRTQNNCRTYFTDRGCESFKQSLIDSEVLTYVLKNRLLVSAVATATPIIANKGLNQRGQYFWEIKMPLLLTYESSTDRLSQGQILTIKVVRESMQVKPQGLGIDELQYEKTIEVR